MYDHPLFNSNFEDVGEFHHKFGLYSVTHDGVGPQPQNRELMRFRLKFLLEELVELMGAMGARFVPEYDPIDHHIVGMDIQMSDDSDLIDDATAFDSLLDLVYVAMGTAHLLGYPWTEGWQLVQRANMSKVRAQPDGSDSKRGSSFDVVKPPGWTPPDIESVLSYNGWDTKEEDA